MQQLINTIFNFFKSIYTSIQTYFTTLLAIFGVISPTLALFLGIILKR